ncbi:hypothetical protein EJ06DRAFT_527931 [Trichodelitschia bisporula]|uniref:Uncharacterized protein n=1 Tax=Trichodelitschia bisporula TaxID=703511 RepID=A0A6G1I451_9PEZI|nr:hypothetical protein EJ06DRAFT_527931 [Trichodelitschia bisporula]
MLARKPPGLRLWRHVLGPLNGDDGAWSIGNGFAAAGLARMIATLGAWEGGKGMVSAKKDMVGWVKGIVEGVKGVDESSGAENGLLRNYVDDESWFGEVAGTALMASAVFRMAVLEPRVFERYVEWAERKAEAVRRHTNPDTGIAAPAVQELNSMVREPIGTGSAEGQSFVMLLYAARRDYIRWQKGEM